MKDAQKANAEEEEDDEEEGDEEEYVPEKILAHRADFKKVLRLSPG